MDTNLKNSLDPEITNLILDSMAGGVFTLDKEGNISYWNNSMQRISGYSAKEVLGKSCQVLSFDL